MVKPLKIKAEPVGQESLPDMLERLGIKKWDLLLVGDGSGSLYNIGRPCGWSCVSVERLTNLRRVWYGSANCGDINFAEMMAYLLPLRHYADKAVKEGSLYDPKDVHIITDAQFVADRAKSVKSGIIRDAEVWQMFKQFANRGLILHWHWATRSSVELNHLADVISKLARVSVDHDGLMKQIPEVCSSFTGIEHLTYGVNPMSVG